MRILPYPGEILSEEFLKPLGMSGAELARKIEVPQNRVTDIIRGRRSISADTALRFSRFFRTSPEFWMNMQASHDLSKTLAEVEKSLKKIKPLQAA